MRKLIAFENISLDGFFVDAKNDMSWAHKNDPEWIQFASENAQGGGVLLFGRKTYELMAGYWPTPLAAEQNPQVADGMNKMQKFVFSRKMTKADWQNTKLLKGDIVSEVRKLKRQPGPGIAILGSGSIVAQLAPTGLIDEYQLVVCPLVLGTGRSLFDGVEQKIPLKLTKSRAFKNGNVVLWYAPTRIQ